MGLVVVSRTLNYKDRLQEVCSTLAIIDSVEESSPTILGPKYRNVFFAILEKRPLVDTN
jgi:hypothetical protein